ncbi:Mediator of RNA polymerase II transcription subunit 11 [Dichanthelium oligosanthes]|uniref:Mediator of RNA polymerase II transcription subunit 11 n=1 Tax=Dichanthelium oligosanthes TaxID=888268 RepID=A0A1E5VUQ2_9POAL|nr:Mediator of RNA polymerase II transcription subunit 11 [Dichanthelium oligosanthes]
MVAVASAMAAVSITTGASALLIIAETMSGVDGAARVSGVAHASTHGDVFHEPPKVSVDPTRLKRIVRVLELAGAVMEELGNSQGPRTDAVGAHCREFMLAMKDIQMTLREEIKSACEYRPFEKCDYSARIANEICVKKLEHVIEKLDTMLQNLEQSSDDI